MKSPILSCAIIVTLALCALNAVYADSATWSLNPVSSDWNTAENWAPNTVPNGPDDIATFGLSHQARVFVSGLFSLEVNELTFSPGASDFTISVTNDGVLTISGIGITNNSGIVQNFVVTTESDIDLTNNATAGENTLFTLAGGHGLEDLGGLVFFQGTANAANGTFVVYGGESRNASGAKIIFADNSNAGNGSFTVKGASVPSGEGGNIDFRGNSSAANGTFVVEGATASPSYAGTVVFDILGAPTAGNGVFVINGSNISGGAGGLVVFLVGTGGNATFIANPGTNGGSGGEINFSSGSDGGEARIEVFGNGKLRLDPILSSNVLTIGSIEGDGLVSLADNKLITGSNDLSTTFSGTIQDTGSLEKIGNGTLTLSSENTYTGGTTIEGGSLVINNTTGSGTGTGLVLVNAGRLNGRGTIAGPVTVGTGSGPGAVLAPGRRGGKPDTLTIQSALTFNSDATYYCGLNSRSVTADEVVADGVTINGAQFSLVGRGGLSLPAGIVFTVINNTSAAPIAGTFANLPDGSTFTIHNNTFQVSYEGGDGNDLTLTVVP